jgi:hypothetical protein
MKNSYFIFTIFILSYNYCVFAQKNTDLLISPVFTKYILDDKKFEIDLPSEPIDFAKSSNKDKKKYMYHYMTFFSQSLDENDEDNICTYSMVFAPKNEQVFTKEYLMSVKNEELMNKTKNIYPLGKVINTKVLNTKNNYTFLEIDCFQETENMYLKYWIMDLDKVRYTFFIMKKNQLASNIEIGTFIESFKILTP